MVVRALPLFSTLITLLAVVTMLSLAYWQLQRAEQKQTRLARIEAKAKLAPYTLQSLKSESDIRDLPLRILGQLATERYFLLDNRIHKGTVGYQVLVPVQTQLGSVLVNLGWVAASQYRDQLPQVSLPQGDLVLEGMVAIPSHNPMIRETATANDGWPRVVQEVSIERFRQWLGDTSLHPWWLLLSETSPYGYQRDWQPVVMPASKHQAYALQWFGLAIAALAVYLFALRKRLQPSH